MSATSPNDPSGFAWQAFPGGSVSVPVDPDYVMATACPRCGYGCTYYANGDDAVALSAAQASIERHWMTHRCWRVMKLVRRLHWRQWR